MPTDRNRGSGRVPGSPWNLSIRPTRSPPPAYRLTASSLPSILPSRCLEYHCTPFTYPLASSILYRVSSPFLPPLHKYPFNFFSISPFSYFFYFRPLSLLRFRFSVFTLSLHIDLPISFRTSFEDFFSLPTDTPQIFLPVSSLKIEEILLSPLSVLIRAFVPATTLRKNPAFFNEILRERRWNVSLCRWQMSALLKTFFGGLMITKKLLDHARVSSFLPFLFRWRFFNLCVRKRLRRID